MIERLRQFLKEIDSIGSDTKIESIFRLTKEIQDSEIVAVVVKRKLKKKVENGLKVARF